MSDNELLSAIANMMNKNTHALEYRMDEMKKELKEDIHNLDVKIDMVEQRLDAKIDGVEQKLTAKINEVDQRLSAQLNEVDQRLSAQIDRINLNLENNIEPRLQNIEECYTSTYNKYKMEVEKQEKMQLDIEVLQDVVKEHGKVLQAITA